MIFITLKLEIIGHPRGGCCNYSMTKTAANDASSKRFPYIYAYDLFGLRPYAPSYALLGTTMLLSYAPIPLLCLCDPPMLHSMFHPMNICSFLMPPPMPSPIILCQILKVLMAYRYLQRGKHLIYAPMSTPMHWCLILCPSPCPSHAFFLCYVWLVCFTNTEKIACTSADT